MNDVYHVFVLSPLKRDSVKVDRDQAINRAKRLFEKDKKVSVRRADISYDESQAFMRGLEIFGS